MAAFTKYGAVASRNASLMPKEPCKAASMVNVAEKMAIALP
jgi:hypothetical protein